MPRPSSKSIREIQTRTWNVNNNPAVTTMKSDSWVCSKCEKVEKYCEVRYGNKIKNYNCVEKSQKKKNKVK